MKHMILHGLRVTHQALLFCQTLKVLKVRILLIQHFHCTKLLEALNACLSSYFNRFFTDLWIETSVYKKLSWQIQI